MRTVITHFFNEEFLLPWWLNHHIELFDHGILIDYGSTDNSVEICKKLAPHWRVVRSENDYFDALLCDFEVMKYESDIAGWKIALTTTEFLCSGNLDALEEEAAANEFLGFRIPVAEMIDDNPDSVASCEQPLVKQKMSGRASSWIRLYHRFKIGAYAPGRHNFFLPSCADVSCEAMILKYTLSPWCDEFLKRKLQIGSRIPTHDVRAGFGVQHMWSREKILNEYKKGAMEARNLSEQIRLAHSNLFQNTFGDGEYLLVTHNKTILFLDGDAKCLRHSGLASAQLNLCVNISGSSLQLRVRDCPVSGSNRSILEHADFQLGSISVKRISHNRVVLDRNSQLIYSPPANNAGFSGRIPYEFAQYTLVPILTNAAGSNSNHATSQ